jgi:hypothetical protein
MSFVDGELLLLSRGGRVPSGPERGRPSGPEEYEQFLPATVPQSWVRARRVPVRAVAALRVGLRAGRSEYSAGR